MVQRALLLSYAQGFMRTQRGYIKMRTCSQGRLMGEVASELKFEGWVGV